MPRHTATIEIVIENDLNQPKTRKLVSEILQDVRMKTVLNMLGRWKLSAFTVSNPRRTRHVVIGDVE